MGKDEYWCLMNCEIKEIPVLSRKDIIEITKHKEYICMDVWICKQKRRKQHWERSIGSQEETKNLWEDWVLNDIKVWEIYAGGD